MIYFVRKAGPYNMKKLVIALLPLLMPTSCCLADPLGIPYVDEIRVYKFDLQLVNSTYWIVQKGNWDWSAQPLQLVCESGGETVARALDPMEAGSAQILCCREALDILAADCGDNTLKFSISDGSQELAWDYPLIPGSHNAMALAYKIWYGEGALWYGGSGTAKPSKSLKRHSPTERPRPFPCLN